MRISDWSSDVCSSDLGGELVDQRNVGFEQLSVRGKRAQHGRNAVGILLFHAPFSLLSIQRRARAKASPVSSHSLKGVPPTAIRKAAMGWVMVMPTSGRVGPARRSEERRGGEEGGGRGQLG